MSALFRAAALQVVARLRRAGMSEAEGRALVLSIEAAAARAPAEQVREARLLCEMLEQRAREEKERAARAEAYAQQLEAELRRPLRPVDDWHEDFGEVLWWRRDEPPWVGSPLYIDWLEDYYEGWTTLPAYPFTKAGGGR